MVFQLRSRWRPVKRSPSGVIGSVYAAAQVDSVRGRGQALEAFAQAREQRLAALSHPEPAASPFIAPLEYSNEPDQSLWGETRIAAYRDSTSLHAEAPLAVLTIPAINLEVPIFDGTSETHSEPRHRPNRRHCGRWRRRQRGLGGPPRRLLPRPQRREVGDAIDVESLEGTTRYRITELSIVEPTDVYVLEPTERRHVDACHVLPVLFHRRRTAAVHRQGRGRN